MRAKALTGHRIGVFGKGGAGKSTLSVFLAEALQEAGYSVLVLDADSTNRGLAPALGVNREPIPLIEFFGGTVFSGDPVTCPVDHPRAIEGAELRLGDLPPRFVGRNPDGVRLVIAGKLAAAGPGAGCDGPISRIARDLRVDDIGADPVVLVDHGAGLEDASRGLVTSLDCALAIVDPTAAAVGVARDLARMATQVRRGVPPATRHLEDPGLVQVVSALNRVRNPAIESQLRIALRDDDARVLAVFGEDPAIGTQWLQEQRLCSGRLLMRARTLAQALEVASRAAAPARSA